MAKERHKIIPASYLMIRKGKKLLLMRRFNTGFMDGMYSFVAGHLEPGESLTEAMVREAKEEAGITIAPKDIRLIHICHRYSVLSKEERIDAFFIADKWKGEIRIMEPGKCDDLSWFDEDRLPKNLVPHLPPILDHIKKGIYYSEAGWDKI